MTIGPGLDTQIPIQVTLARSLLPGPPVLTYLGGMEVHFTPETEKKLKDLAAQSGRGADDLVEDAMAGYFAEALHAHEMLDRRYDDLKSGKVKPVDGDQFFENLRRREDELLKKRSPQ